MAEYIDKDLFLASMGLTGDETKYGNRDAKHQHKSYSTYMAYEIMDSVDDAIAADVVEVVRCKDCKHWSSDCGVEDRVCLKIYSDGQASVFAWQERKSDDFCSYGERRNDHADHHD